MKRALATTAEQLRGRDWHIQFNTNLGVVAAIRDELAALPMPVVLDHFARAKAALGPSQPGFDALLALVKSGRAYVKISAAYRISDQKPDYPDAAAIAQAIVAANPDRVIWGSNWPHPGRGKTRADTPRPIRATTACCSTNCRNGCPMRQRAGRSWWRIRQGFMGLGARDAS